MPATAIAHLPAPSAPPPAAVPPEESLAEGRLVLPGGILDADGARHQVVVVRELTGRDEEVLGDRRYASGAQQVTDLLAQVVVRVEGREGAVDTDLVADMLVGDRDYLLLRLRQLAVGDAVHQVMRCPSPACGQKVDVDFLVSEIPVRRAERLAPMYDLALGRAAFDDDPDSAQCTLRLPTGRDQAAVAALAPMNEGAANTALLARLLQRVGRRARVHEGMVRDLPFAVRRTLLGFLADTSPGPDLAIEIQCPHCGGDMSYPFDLQGFFFSEWAMRLDVLYEHVHVLALHYHWAERDILAMSRARRERYVALLARHMEGATP